MSADIQRDRVRALVRRELERRLPASGPPAQAAASALEAVLAEIYQGPECHEDPDMPERRPCVIEPDRPCTNTGYCKKLGY